MFALWIAVIMAVLGMVSAGLFCIAPRGESTWRAAIGAFVGLAALFFAAVLVIMGLNWLIQSVAVALGF